MSPKVLLEVLATFRPDECLISRRDQVPKKAKKKTKKKVKKPDLSFFEKVKKTATNFADTTVEELEKSGTLDEIKKHKESVEKKMDEMGITAKAKEISDITSGHLDQISGKKILEVVEQRLEMQTEYNDILASKLEEALKRIEKLENKFKKKS